MFCFQCEQTAGGVGCQGRAGVCGKTANTADLQDRLTGALVDLALAVEGKQVAASTDRALLKGLFMTLTNVCFDEKALQTQIEEIQREKAPFLPQNGADAAPFDVASIWRGPADQCSLQSLLLFGMRGVAAYAYHSMVLGVDDREVTDFLYQGLRALANCQDSGELLNLVLAVGECNLKALAALDRANTAAYGTPKPTTVSLTVEKGPFIIVSGHDLHDLEQLLKQTAGKGINIYTHGEMLPAHGYPKLKDYPHLKGHFGSAWQNQQRELAAVPAPILFTTNCLMVPKDSYADRVFTTAAVGYAATPHIDEEKDFTPVIERALALGGYQSDTLVPGWNGGAEMTTGFGHSTILSVAGQIVDAVKAGAIKRFFLVGGCDGSRKERSYFTDFVKATPSDTMILTLGCGKFRFNDLDLSKIGDLPRLLDMGQCNDAYGAIQVAVALAQAFDCSVNDLPLTLVLSWYEQKAVAVLLTLLHLGIKNIYIGPTLPAFISPNILKALVDAYGLTPTSTPAEDLAKMMK